MKSYCAATAALACAAMIGATDTAAAAAKTLPPLGSAAAAHQPRIETRIAVPAGASPRAPHAGSWFGWYPKHSPHNDPLARAAVHAARRNVPLWSGSVKYKKKTYDFTMVGGSPLGTGAGTTKVRVVVIPLVFQFNNATFDATGPFPGCSPAGATTMVAQSPLFQNVTFKAGRVNVGTSQFIDLFQRENFWKYVKGSNPKYHLIFTATQAPAVAIKVNGDAVGSLCNNGNTGAIGSVDIDSFDNYLEGTLIPQLRDTINPGVVPLFLAYDVIFGGAAGYHNAMTTRRGVQIYGVSTYLDAGSDLGLSIPDVEVLSHEMAEFTDDPLTDNPTPPWGHIGQQPDCQANLEPGDPLTGLSYATVAMAGNGYTYTVTDLANFSWFYRQSPSIAVGGRYTMFNYFSSPPPICK